MEFAQGRAPRFVERKRYHFSTCPDDIEFGMFNRDTCKIVPIPFAAGAIEKVLNVSGYFAWSSISLVPISWKERSD